MLTIMTHPHLGYPHPQFGEVAHIGPFRSLSTWCGIMDSEGYDATHSNFPDNKCTMQYIFGERINVQ